MKKAVIRIKDEVYCSVAGLEPHDQEFLFNKFSFFVEGFQFMPLYKLGVWNGKVPFFSKEGKIFLRLIDKVVPYLEGWNYEVELIDERKQSLFVTERITDSWFLDKEGIKLKIELRQYQVEAVNKALDAMSGIVLAATGAGKTWMIAALADVLNRQGLRVLIIVPSSDLVSQTISTLQFGLLDVGEYSGKNKDWAHETVVSTWQALQYNPSVVEHFQALIIDEAHGATAKSIGELITAHGKNCVYRYGFTGTLPKSTLDQMTIEGSIGSTIYEISAAFLIENNYLAKLEIEPIQVIDEGIEEEFPDFAAEKTFLAKSSKRLDLLADIIISKAQTYGNTLVLVNSIKAGKTLQSLIKDSVFLYGESSSDVRAEWYSLFKDRDDLIVIATFGIASTGISIDRIFCEIMIDVGKSFVKCIQSIGRGLRMADDKDRVHVVDVHSNLRWSMKHWKERNKYYKQAQYPVLKTTKIKV